MLLTRLEAHGIAKKQLFLYGWPIRFKRQCFLPQACHWLLFSRCSADH